MMALRTRVTKVGAIIVQRDGRRWWLASITILDIRYERSSIYLNDDTFHINMRWPERGEYVHVEHGDCDLINP